MVILCTFMYPLNGYPPSTLLIIELIAFQWSSFSQKPHAGSSRWWQISRLRRASFQGLAAKGCPSRKARLETGRGSFSEQLENRTEKFPSLGWREARHKNFRHF